MTNVAKREIKEAVYFIKVKGLYKAGPECNGWSVQEKFAQRFSHTAALGEAIRQGSEALIVDSSKV